MKISQYEIWLANLNPSKGTEPGKVRPVVVVQTNLLNDIHLSTLICPITTNILPDVKILRVALTKKQLDEKSDILVDQLRAIDLLLAALPSDFRLVVKEHPAMVGIRSSRF